MNPLLPRLDTLGINTDLYELTMAAAYFQSRRHEESATFELFTRCLPPKRNFLVAAGLEQALCYVLNTGFDGPGIDHIRSLEAFRKIDPSFFDYLRGFRFSGDVHALPEGTICFENEPLLQVTAPIIEAQLLETLLINVINFQTAVASKAARVCLAARGRDVVDFGSRRAHSPQAALMAARACWIAGCAGTSNVLAGREMGIPVFGTMAHSFVQFFDEEKEAFQEFLLTFPEQTTLLIDTYDTLAAVDTVVELGGDVQAVRLDSGNLERLAPAVRERLDRNGLQKVQIIASGNLNEERILAFALQDIPIDSFGVGTDLVVSSDAPGCDLVYKLVEVLRGGEVLPRMKTSHEKTSLPYRKQIYRRLENGLFREDRVTRWDEAAEPGSKPLLRRWIHGGKLEAVLPSVEQIRSHADGQLKQVPAALKNLHSSEEYPVHFSATLLETQRRLQEIRRS